MYVNVCHGERLQTAGYHCGRACVCVCVCNSAWQKVWEGRCSRGVRIVWAGECGTQCGARLGPGLVSGGNCICAHLTFLLICVSTTLDFFFITFGALASRRVASRRPVPQVCRILRARCILPATLAACRLPPAGDYYARIYCSYKLVNFLFWASFRLFSDRSAHRTFPRITYWYYPRASKLKCY